MEDYDKIKKVLALGFMHFLDENRTEGKMCLSKGECADIEKAFNEQDWPKLVRYLDKYRESEDEKMLNQLHSWMKEFGGAEEYTEKVYEWIKGLLEKQKEQKPEEIWPNLSNCIHDCKNCLAKCLYRKEENPEQKLSLCDNCAKKSICLDVKYDNSRAVEQCINFVDKEQKPLTDFEAAIYSYLSDDTSGKFNKEVMHKCAVERAKILLELARKEQEPAECIEDSVKFEEGFKTGRELGFREGVESVKPVEWSGLTNKEVAITTLNQVVKSLKEKGLWPGLQQSLIDLVKDIEDLHIVNPSLEWSEGDEKILDSLIRLYSREYSAYAWPWANGAFTYGDVVNFLKSLRPSWKPSEEQIATLEECGECKRCVKELYEQLQKLYKKDEKI